MTTEAAREKTHDVTTYEGMGWLLEDGKAKEIDCPLVLPEVETT